MIRKPIRTIQRLKNGREGPGFLSVPGSDPANRVLSFSWIFSKGVFSVNMRGSFSTNLNLVSEYRKAI